MEQTIWFTIGGIAGYIVGWLLARIWWAHVFYESLRKKGLLDEYKMHGGKVIE